jgi:cytochrome P450
VRAVLENAMQRRAGTRINYVNFALCLIITYFFRSILIFSIISRLCQMADHRIYSGWRQNKWLLDVLGEQSKVRCFQNVFTQCVKKVLNEKRDESGRDVSCLLEALVANKELSQDDIASTLTCFIILGYDRLATTLCFSLLELAKQTPVQHNIRHEVEKSTPIKSFAQLMSLKALGNFVNEIHRLYPAVSCIPKWITVGIPLEGHFIPPNSSVFVYLNGTGRDAQRFDRPDHFNADRENLTETFGGKNHLDINLPSTLMKVQLANLVKRYSFSAQKGEVEIGNGLSLRLNEVRVNVKAR